MSEESDYEKLFRKNTVQRKTKGGFCIKCRKGFWRVDAPSKAFALKEAKHYFSQYFSDGEYNDSEEVK